MRPSTLVAITARLAALAAALVLGNACGPNYPNCNNDNDCHSHHEVCVNSHCQQCRANSDCGPDHTCLRNRCVAGTNACENDTDCASGQHCVDRRCVPRAECDEHRACPSGRPCVEGRCGEPQASSNTGDDDENNDNQGRLCRFTPIYFAFDNAQLDDDARRALQSAAECLQRENNTRYVLVGRADPRGTAEYNLALGERRARIAQSYLRSLGVTETRIEVSSEGSEGATGTDDASWRLDRRVDFRPRQ